VPPKHPTKSAAGRLAEAGFFAAHRRTNYNFCPKFYFPDFGFEAMM